MSVRPITDTLRLLQGGLFIDECSDKLAETVKQVDETGKPGKLTITLVLKKSGAGAISIDAVVTNKAPEAKADADLLWATVEGNLVTENPRQRKLDLRVAEPAQREVRAADDGPRIPLRDIDPDTGEIRSPVAPAAAAVAAGN